MVPHEDETWVRRFVPNAQLDLDNWQALVGLEGIHDTGMRYDIRKQQRCDVYTEIAVAQSYLDWLSKTDVKLYSFSKKDGWDIQAHQGPAADYHFLEAAHGAFRSQYGQSLKRYYRNHPPREELLIVNEWLIVISDVLVRSPRSRRHRARVEY